MGRVLSSLLSGLLFGAGLALAGMTDPSKVLGFLDIAGHWDPSLLFVLGGAVTLATLAFRLILRRARPLLDTRYHLPTATKVDQPLVLGSVLFGIGWGVSGYCPGPAVAMLAAPNAETWIFLPALLAGALLFRLQTRFLAGRTSPQEAGADA